MPVIINPDKTLQNNLMAFGFECEKGWYPLINELIAELNKFSEEIHVLQVKEKYATLRFYISSGTKEIYDVIDKYEWLSGHVCERCSAFWTAKERVRHGWYKTLCDKCVKKDNNSIIRVLSRYHWFRRLFPRLWQYPSDKWETPKLSIFFENRQ